MPTREPLPTLFLAVMIAGAAPFAPAAWAQGETAANPGLVRGLLPSVVGITGHVADTAKASPGKPFEIKNAVGSGFVIDPSGIIVTNWHVLSDCYEIFVTFADGKTVKAEVLNAARVIDIALLKVEAGHPLTPAHWGDSAKVQIGDPVLAIGNPLGVGLSVTSGIVSALNRNIMDTPYDDFIQTDAPINHGNSGGPLFNAAGDVVGINTALVSDTTSSAGLGFAIPSNDAKSVVERLTHFGWVRPSFAGMKLQSLTPEMAMALGQTEPHGSIVAQVIPNGPAAQAGIRVGDLVVSFNGHQPADDRELLRDIANAPAGQPIPVGIVRNGQPMEVMAALAEWPKMAWEQRDGPLKVPEPRWNIPDDLGLKVRPLTKDLRAQNGLSAGQPGVLIASVTPGADAMRSKVVAGDVLVRIGDAAIASAADLQRAIDGARAEGKAYVLALLLQKAAASPGAKEPAPKWLALRVAH